MRYQFVYETMGTTTIRQEPVRPSCRCGYCGHLVVRRNQIGWKERLHNDQRFGQSTSFLGIQMSQPMQKDAKTYAWSWASKMPRTQERMALGCG